MPSPIRPKPLSCARILSGALPDGWENALPVFPPSPKGDATRNTGGKALNALAKVIPNLVGGSADLAGSNKTTIEGQPFIKAGDFGGPNIHFGVREHGMAGILNGMALHGGLIPFGGTFLVFSDYMRGGMRLSALEPACASSTCSRTTASASAKTVPPTSRSSTWPPCAPCPT